MSRLILFNKPFGVLCQFRDKDGRPVLADYIDRPGVYPAGRLDHDSEGLLLLTGDGDLQARIADPRFKLPKTYWAQVEGAIDDAALARLAAGVELNDGPTLPATARRLDPPALWERTPPVRYRAAIPTSWIELTLREGRNRQVRRMTAAVGFPTLRLVRVATGPWSLDGLAPGQWREIDVDPATLPAASGPAPGRPATARGGSGQAALAGATAGKGSRDGQRPVRERPPREDNRPLRGGATPAAGQGKRPARPGSGNDGGNGNRGGGGKAGRPDAGRRPTARSEDRDDGGQRPPRPVRPPRP